MGNITLLDILLMMVDTKRNGHQANIDVIKSIFERTHNYYTAILGSALALIGTLIGLIIVVVIQANVYPIVVVAVVVALVVLLVIITVVMLRLGNLQRRYLDILQVYYLIARFF